MKVRIKSGECPPYLTVGKVYESHSISIKKPSVIGCKIIDDLGRELSTNLDYSSHLNGGSWEVVDENK